jgi:hypothetical protein
LLTLEIGSEFAVSIEAFKSSKFVRSQAILADLDLIAQKATALETNTPSFASKLSALEEFENGQDPPKTGERVENIVRESDE